MLFSSFNFILFLLLFIILIKTSAFKVQYLFIFLGSLIFYSFSGLENTFVLFSVCFFSAFISKKLPAYISIIIVLLPLFVYKYLEDLLYFIIGSDNYFNLSQIPPGLSFVTFSAITLIIWEKANNIHQYSSTEKINYLVFFPQLIAGPIVRPMQLIPQLEKKLDLTVNNISLGLFIFTIGLIKKIIIADSFSDVVTYASNNSFVDVISAMAFSWQIYFDFSGYTDMAIGIALMFGIDLPKNFSSPYLATSIKEFWRKWHISLTSFFRDYIYIPLGGNQLKGFKYVLVVIVTFLLSGIWHGSGLNFIIWGLLHGLFLLISRIPKIDDSKLLIFTSWLYTQIIIIALWLPFRFSFPELMIFDYYVFHHERDFSEIIALMLLFFVFYITQAIDKIELIIESISRLNPLFVMPFMTIILLMILFINEGTSQKFIYFDF